MFAADGEGKDILVPKDFISDARIFQGAIVEERDRQDRMHGGPDHDDSHSRRDWIAFICLEASKADRQTCEGFERQMVQVAALAQAAYESMRRNPR
jgi:hypothetical protein